MAATQPIRGSNKKHRPMSEINVVPYIDVMLVLLVIFMATAPLLTQGVSVELPKVDSELIDETKQADPLVISIDRAGDFYLSISAEQKKAIELDKLIIRIKAARSQTPQVAVLIRGDQQVAYGKVVTLMAQLQQAGIENVGLITEPAES
ncbi:protein TolR [Litoribrevibacter albus]|uniref:Tol-Pal system protein TolR n=1 Tax=Litoribrevibacter albus TaxID=1473156 RepID=A0AA37W7C4_9GAMM|nr:protein TolR [Litoribrevibacter albus]GLQ31244.1 protein TolR [Litoribrevibacter albus]